MAGKMDQGKVICAAAPQLPHPPPGKTGWPWTSDVKALTGLSFDGVYPRITIVTPCYNQARFVEETLRSVLLQGYPNLEYIVVDGGSTDGSTEIIRRYERYLSYWVSERDNGQAHAINKGFAMATGEILGWLNSDDILLPGALHSVARAFRSQHVDFVFGQRRFIDEQSRFVGEFVIPVRNPLNYMLYGMGALNQECCFWRRSILDVVGGLDESLHYALDYDFFLRVCAAARYRWRYVPEFLGCFRVYDGQKTAHHDTRGRCGDVERRRARVRFIRKHRVGGIRLLLGGLFYGSIRRAKEHGVRSLLRVPRWRTVREVMGLEEGRSDSL